MNHIFTGIRYQMKRWLPLALVTLIIVSYTGLVSLVAGQRARVKENTEVCAEHEELLDDLADILPCPQGQKTEDIKTAFHNARGYEAKMDYVTELLTKFKAEREDASNRAFAEANSYEKILRAKAEKMAKVLYVYRDLTDWDIITAIWCFFNRVDITAGEYAYLSTLEEVIDQPGQWTAYSEENPVVDRIYRLAYAQLEIWFSGGHRPCSPEYVFLVWDSKGIHLSTTLGETRQTKTWKYAG